MIDVLGLILSKYPKLVRHYPDVQVALAIAASDFLSKGVDTFEVLSLLRLDELFGEPRGGGGM
jgi:hypothetical protein